MDSKLHPYGQPCPEGGSVAIENVALQINSNHKMKHCVIFYLPDLNVNTRHIRLAQQAQSIQQRERRIWIVLSECIPYREAKEIPVNLARIAICAMDTMNSNNDNVPCYGVAVVPRHIRSPARTARVLPADAWART